MAICPFPQTFPSIFRTISNFSTLTRLPSASSSLAAVKPALVVVALGVPLCPRDHLLPPFSVGVGPHGGASSELGCHDAAGHRTTTFHPHTHTRPSKPRCCWQNGSSCSRENPDRDEVKFQLFLPNSKISTRTEIHIYTHTTSNRAWQGAGGSAEDTLLLLPRRLTTERNRRRTTTTTRTCQLKVC